VEVEENTGASISPKVASAMAVGGSRCGKAAAAAMQVAREATGGEREEVARAGLGQFDRPRPEPAGLAQPGGLGGLIGQLGLGANRPGGLSGFSSIWFNPKFSI
jgi:hypothetical protein